MYDYSSIQVVHLEVTSKCNASCPQCSRNVNGGRVNPLLPLTGLSLKDVQIIMNENFVKQLNRIYMCGNFGDPIMAKDTLEIFKWIKTINPDIHLSMFTNGSGRSTEWWKELAMILNSNNQYVRFGIDGLSDTNALYRKGTSWEKIITNVKTFIQNGGEAEWDYIVFKHNEHQIDEARKLSKDLGFKKFTTKKTSRFFDSKIMMPIEKFSVQNKEGDTIYYLEMPTNKEYRNINTKENHLIQKYGSMDNYLDSACVNCKVKQEKSIFISSEGLIFPCCWTALQLYAYEIPTTIQTKQIQELLNNLGGKDSINAKLNNLYDIVNGSFFSEIENSWKLESLNKGKLKICSRICGSEFDAFAAQFDGN